MASLDKVEDILQMQPQTANIAVVFGSSQLDRIWLEQCRREFQKFNGRVEFTWMTDLTMEQLIEKCSNLPPRSFILHGFFLVDAAGIASEKSEALRRLHETANAPIFAPFTSELGIGAIGGRLFQNSEIGVEGGRIAQRILRGEKADQIATWRYWMTTKVSVDHSAACSAPPDTNRLPMPPPRHFSMTSSISPGEGTVAEKILGKAAQRATLATKEKRS